VISEWAEEISEELPGGGDDSRPLLPAWERVKEVYQQGPGRVPLRLLHATGLRVDEALLLVWEGDELRLQDGRPIVCDVSTLGLVRDWAGSDTPGEAFRGCLPHLIGWMREAAQGTGLGKRFAGLQRPLTLQLFRHSFAVRCLELGMDLWVLSRLLGHRDLRTTQQYISMAMQDCRRIYRQTHPLQILKRKPQSHLLEEETLALMQAPARSRDRLIFRLLYSSGLRVGELLGLVAGDIDSDQGLLFVRAGKGEQDRYGLLDDESLRQLREYASTCGTGGRLFQTTRAHVHKLVQRAARQLGLEEKYASLGQIVSPHSFRHACASHCYANGMEPQMLQKMLGHEVLRNTLLYVHVAAERVEQEFYTSLIAHQG